jgi:hypothetical protein
MKKVALLALVAASLFGIGAMALAAPSCTGWMKQNDGSYWRTCVDDKGRQYCQRSYRNHVSNVSCR